MTILYSFFALLAGLGLGVAFRRWQERRADQLALPNLAGESGPLYKIAETLQGYFDQSAHPKDLTTHPEFERGVKLLLADKYSASDLLNYAAGTNGVISCMALEAVARRDKIEQDIFEPIANLMPNLGYWPIYFAFHALTKHTDRPLVAAVMARANLAWRSPIATQILREFIEARVAADERPEFTDELNLLKEEDQLEHLESALREIGETLTGRMLEQAQQYRLALFLRGIGS
ncbi:MAG: hypothetical protein AAB401_02530, partial [Acidobacteriota bacterium]